jgi:putative phosphoserine phosphatase/1-acylglycerol-3-phosphate O-acyltransferase
MASLLRPAAFFDVDRTLVGPRSMERVFVARLIREGFLGPVDLARYLGHLACNLDGVGSGLTKTNKRHLAHKDPHDLARLARRCFRQDIAPLISPRGREAVAAHRRQGHLVVLLTGTLQPLAELLAEELGADLALAAGLAEEGGRLSGALSTPRPYGPEKARLVRELAAQRGLDLATSYAYGDHHSDRHVLASVGHPFAVNPHPLLKREARRRGWPILEF